MCPNTSSTERQEDGVHASIAANKSEPLRYRSGTHTFLFSLRPDLFLACHRIESRTWIVQIFKDGVLRIQISIENSYTPSTSLEDGCCDSKDIKRGRNIKSGRGLRQRRKHCKWKVDASIGYALTWHNRGDHPTQSTTPHYSLGHSCMTHMAM